MDIFGNGNILSVFIQLLVIVLVVFAVSLVSRGNTVQHCKTMRIALFLQIISILIFMYPVMSDFLELGFGTRSLITQMWLHHLGGVVVVLLVVYINMAMKGKVKFMGDNIRLMKITFLLWLLIFIGGIILYLALWHGISLL
jgi:uncharacterized membrane protein YozB (DUF420 family)